MRIGPLVLAFAVPFALVAPASAQYGGVMPQSGFGTYGSNNSQWRDNNWRNGPANDWRTKNWREDRSENWRTKNWREEQTETWRPRETPSKEKEKTNKSYNASEDECAYARDLPSSYSKAVCR